MLTHTDTRAHAPVPSQRERRGSGEEKQAGEAGSRPTASSFLSFPGGHRGHPSLQEIFFRNRSNARKSFMMPSTFSFLKVSPAADAGS